MVLFVCVFGMSIDAKALSNEADLKTCLTSGSEKECVLTGDVNLTAPIVALENKTVNLNGHNLKGDVLGTIKINGGNYYTSDDFKILGATGASYVTTNAVVKTKLTNVKGSYNVTDITVVSGDVSLGFSMATMPGQTLTIGKDASFTIPSGLELQLYSLLNIEGKLTIKGTLRQINSIEIGALKTANAPVYNQAKSAGVDSNAAIIGDLIFDGGTYYTWDPVYNFIAMAGKNATYSTDYAVFNLDKNLNIIVKEGDVVLGDSTSTMANQKLTLNKGATFTVPANKTFIIKDTTIVDVYGVFETSDKSHFEKINLKDTGLFVLNTDSLETAKLLAGNSYCVYEIDKGVFGITTKHSDLKLVGKVEATTDKEGYTGDMVCSKCGEVVKKGVAVPKLIENPKTFDGINFYITLTIVSFVALLFTATYIKKKNKIRA